MTVIYVWFCGFLLCKFSKLDVRNYIMSIAYDIVTYI